jgi:rubrerythrin
MTTGQEKTTQALQYCIQMETEGKEFYLKASKACKNDLGKKLLLSMAEQEDYHRRKFEQIFIDLNKTQKWPRVEYKQDSGKALKTIFSEASAEAGVKAAKTELEAIQKAMQMEDKSYDYYHQHAQQVVKGPEKDFYEKIAGEEREHKLILTDYFEYLQDPAGWFVKAEHSAIDG